LVGTLWSSFEPSSYFLLLAGIAAVAAVLLRGISTLADPASKG
jgi:hypothetical protein